MTGGEAQQLGHEGQQDVGSLDLLRVAGREPRNAKDVLSCSERPGWRHALWKLMGLEWLLARTRARGAGRIYNDDLGRRLRQVVQEGLLAARHGEVERPDGMLGLVRVVRRIDCKGIKTKGASRGTEPGTACENFN